MSCLYCGGEIGPFQTLRDAEFCSSDHRTRYRARLARALDLIGAPEPAPTGAAGFISSFSIHSGDAKHASASPVFSGFTHRIEIPVKWRMSVPSVIGRDWRRLSSAGPSTPDLVAYPKSLAFAMARDAALCGLPPFSIGGSQFCPDAAIEPPAPRAREEAPAKAATAEREPERAPNSVCGWAPLPAPGAKRSEASPLASESLVAGWAPQLPETRAGKTAPAFAGPCGEYAPVPSASPLEVEVTAASADCLATSASCALRAYTPPAGSGAAFAGPCEGYLPVPAAIPVVVEVTPVSAEAVADEPGCSLRPFAPAAAPGSRATGLAGVSWGFLAVPPACPVEAEVTPVSAGRLASTPTCVLRPYVEAAARVSGVAVFARGGPGFLPVPQAWPVAIDVMPVSAEPFAQLEQCMFRPRLWPSRSPAPALALAGAKPVRVEGRAEARAFAFAEEAGGLGSLPVIPETLSGSGSAAAIEAPALPGADVVLPPDFLSTAAAPDPRLAPTVGELSGAAPELRLRDGSLAPAKEDAADGADLVDFDGPYPIAGMLQLEYHSQGARGTLRPVLNWNTSPIPLALPFGLPGLAHDRAYGSILGTRSGKAAQSGERATISVMPPPPAAASGVRGKLWRSIEAVAASLLVGAALWYGASALRLASQLSAMKQDASAPENAALPQLNPVGPPSSAPRPEGHGPVAWLRRQAAKRAAVELTDSFGSGMEAWGMEKNAWASGWSRSAGGYIHPGELALFHPSQAYSDYRLEFFAGIERKSVGWVVRASDRRNYYAMKFTVVDPGLRPVIAMVHYSVVGGKPGRKVEVPLSVMVHNNEPYHVAVEVKGNRVVTSIEGQRVDEWTDSTLAKGGIGFFSEAGERARLYWMKVAANDDLMGKICARVAGAFARDPGTTAALVGAPELPGRMDGLWAFAQFIRVGTPRRPAAWADPFAPKGLSEEPIRAPQSNCSGFGG